MLQVKSDLTFINDIVIRTEVIIFLKKWRKLK